METLRQEFAKSEAMRRRIMRRVWYAFTLSIVLRPAIVIGFLFGASIIAFWKLVSITSIVENLLNVRVGEAPNFVANAFVQAEFMTVSVFAVIMVVGCMMTLRLVSLLRLSSRQGGDVWQNA